ncbi:hypothetical protein EC973_003803 [Apophysomyces ossiformis]|uniref:Rho-GAP domain-containing protein n=1 Tax=Apophysomyces ossiformis TaxID=679940 RepID=A0A8H7BST6_9FUNG|nr:hypothetical protein EC973_003803 [Apophysomyces ossiformis]
MIRQEEDLQQDLMNVSIYSVGTLMQDTLWRSSERIIPKKVWRMINYETCTLFRLSRYISKEGHELLQDILDFLVEVMQHKQKNRMNAYHLGEAMGKSVLAPNDCDVIMAEKASHFLMRMIIDHARRTTMSKQEATRAKAKAYDRRIQHIHQRTKDWMDKLDGLSKMLEEEDNHLDPNQYDDTDDEDADDRSESMSTTATMPMEKAWISIFSQDLTDQCDQAAVHPLLLRILVHPENKNPIEWSDPRKSFHFQDAFNEFKPKWEAEDEEQLRKKHGGTGLLATEGTRHPLRRIHRSFSHLRLNLRKIRSQQSLCDHDSALTFQDPTYARTPNVKTMMKKVMRSMRK